MTPLHYALASSPQYHPRSVAVDPRNAPHFVIINAEIWSILSRDYIPLAAINNLELFKSREDGA
jgi:hypothetical protein